MKKTFTTFIIVLALAFSGCGEKAKKDAAPAGKTGTPAAAQDLKPQTLCPVMGNPIDRKIYVDFQGQRVYFCDNGCAAAFSKDPEKYMKKIAEDKVLLESVQTSCPVMGGAINKKYFRDYKGRRVYFCCPGCLPEFDKDPEKYLKKLPGIPPGPSGKGP
jgi:YHS domain-containing protein